MNQREWVSGAGYKSYTSLSGTGKTYYVVIYNLQTPGQQEIYPLLD